jgi:uncharacterized delta-60 repeat protein
VTSLAIGPDGNILIGGTFEKIGDVSRYGLARLLSTGSLDASFDPGLALSGQSGLVGFPLATAAQEDGNVIIGGTFEQFDGLGRTNLVRLQTNGALDSNFNAAVTIGFGTPSVRAIALQPDGKIVVGGSFSFVNGVFRNGLARLNSDGSIDLQFHSNDLGLDPTLNFPLVQVEALALQSDGQVLIGGSFGEVDGQPRVGIARIKGTDLIPTEPLIYLGQANGKYELKFTGTPGRAYFLQTSTNLTDWPILGQATDTGGGLFQIEDSSSDNNPVRYFRVISQ